MPGIKDLRTVEDDQDNGIFVVLENEDLFHPLGVSQYSARLNLSFWHPQLIFKRYNDDGEISMSLESYPGDDVEELFTKVIDSDHAKRMLDRLKKLGCEIIYQGPCFE